MICPNCQREHDTKSDCECRACSLCDECRKTHQAFVEKERAELDLVETNELIRALVRRSEIFSFAMRPSACKIAGAKPVLAGTMMPSTSKCTAIEALGFLRFTYVQAEMNLVASIAFAKVGERDVDEPPKEQ